MAFLTARHGTYSNPGTQVASRSRVLAMFHRQTEPQFSVTCVILWDCRENFSHDDGTIIHSHLVYFTSYYLSFLPTKYTRFIIFISSPSPPPQKNINSVSSRYRFIMTGHHFLLVSAASGKPCILTLMHMQVKSIIVLNPEFMLQLHQ